jgi:cell filamentation protein, protein adenylyltransferase
VGAGGIQQLSESRVLTRECSVDEQLAEILQAPPDPKHPYVYRGTATHINKFGILNPDALERVVRTVTALRQEMLLQKPIPGQFDLAHLCGIHHFLFQDIYDWAGQTRIIEFDRDGIVDPLVHLKKIQVDPTNIKREGPPFGRQADIVPETNRVLRELKQEDLLRGLEQPEFSDRLAHYILELYHIHPFRDGNGRTIRTFLGQLATLSGWNLDMESVPQLDRHMAAYVAHCGDPGPFENQVRQSLSRNGTRDSQRD